MPKLKTSSVQVTFRIKQSARKKLLAAAEEMGMTESGFIREAVTEKLHRDKAQGALIKNLQDFQSAVRGLKSGMRLSHAAVTGLARLMIICMREPTGDALQAAIAVAPAREEAYRKHVLEEWKKEEPMAQDAA